MHGQSAVTTHLFTDIEGSTRLWEQEPDRMGPALARHDALTRAGVEQNHGRVVKTTGDGFHAVFDDPLHALAAILQLQLSLTDCEATGGVPLQVRSALHAGIDERRDNDFFGPVVNRAARIMSSAHGGQILISQAVATLIADRLPKDVTLRDLGRVRLRDMASAEAVFQVTHPQLRQEFPVLRSLEATPNNLPQQVTSFIGRERDLAEVKKLLHTNRLLTLLGVGGLGKTRLSIQVAAEVMDDFPDGVWFIELAALADERLVPQAVASVLGVKEGAGRPVIEALVKYVKDRHVLIILDNCEHLVHACAETAKALLQAGPNIKVLSSSREPLRVTGETTYHLPPLSVPDPSKALTLASLSAFEAVHLFAIRATAAQPVFAVTDQNAAAVAQICHSLDGIPLAIELAAARIRSLSADAIAARLGDRFRLLTRGDQTALPRQQTLRALIDWSYDLLTEGERALLRRLSVFAGGWTLEAAAVAASNETAEVDVLDPLTLLVEKSLVVLEADGARYRLLDTVQQYAQERLRESGEEDEVRTRHLAFYVALAEKARPELRGADQGLWLARLDLERENLLSAHAWCDRAEHGVELGLRLVSAVRVYWFNRGMLAIGHRCTVEALNRTSKDARTAARSRALFHAGQFDFFMGRYDEARGYLEESLTIAREIGDKVRMAAVLQPLGLAYLEQGNYSVALGHLEEGVALARELNDKPALAAALNALAQLHRLKGDLDMAQSLYDQVVVLARELGDRYNIAIGLLNLAIVAIGRGNADQACRLLIEILAIGEEIGSKPVGQSVLEVSAGLAALVSAWEITARFFGAAETQVEQTGLHRDPADEGFLRPLVAKAKLKLGDESFSDFEYCGRALTYEQAIPEARAWLEQIRAAQTA